MSAVTRPRGPLPRRVYWFRRVLVLAVAFGLVFGIARLLGATSGDATERAAQVAAPQPSGTGAASATPSPGPESRAAGKAPAEKRERKQREKRKQRKERLAQPDGPCLDSDVVVTPQIRTQPAGQQVKIVLQVGTLESDACYWEVSPDSVFVNIASEELGMLWTTQHCVEAVPTADVVARQEKPARVAFFWDGRESDEGCTGTAPWVTSGSYLAESAARGSTELQEAVFVLGPAATPTITVTPTPTPKPKSSRGSDGSDRSDGSDGSDGEDGSRGSNGEA